MSDGISYGFQVVSRVFHMSRSSQGVDASYHQVAHHLAGDAGGGGQPAHNLAIAGIDSKQHTHDLAITTGERDLMIACVERRFGISKAAHPVEWLYVSNGSAYICKDTLDTATALGLKLCFTPVRSPQSNGIAEAFVKTFKRDYARLSILPDAETVIALLPAWFRTATKFTRTQA